MITLYWAAGAGGAIPYNELTEEATAFLYHAWKRPDVGLMVAIQSRLDFNQTLQYPPGNTPYHSSALTVEGGTVTTLDLRAFSAPVSPDITTVAYLFGAKLISHTDTFAPDGAPPNVTFSPALRSTGALSAPPRNITLDGDTWANIESLGLSAQTSFPDTTRQGNPLTERLAIPRTDEFSFDVSWNEQKQYKLTNHYSTGGVPYYNSVVYVGLLNFVEAYSISGSGPTPQGRRSIIDGKDLAQGANIGQNSSVSWKLGAVNYTYTTKDFQTQYTQVSASPVSLFDLGAGTPAPLRLSRQTICNVGGGTFGVHLPAIAIAQFSFPSEGVLHIDMSGSHCLTDNITGFHLCFNTGASFNRPLSIKDGQGNNVYQSSLNSSQFGSDMTLLSKGFDIQGTTADVTYDTDICTQPQAVLDGVIYCLTDFDYVDTVPALPMESNQRRNPTNFTFRSGYNDAQNASSSHYWEHGAKVFFNGTITPRQTITRARALVRQDGSLLVRDNKHILWGHKGMARVWSGDPKTGNVEASDNEGATYQLMANAWTGVSGAKPLDFESLPQGGACSLAKVGTNIQFVASWDGITWQAPVTVCAAGSSSAWCVRTQAPGGAATLTITDMNGVRYDSDQMGAAGSWVVVT